MGQKLMSLDMVANTWMRASGEAIATFALESAINELAYDMEMDPIELRRINEPAKDPTKEREFTKFEDDEGAYRFGYEGRSRYADRDSQAAETDLNRDWEGLKADTQDQGKSQARCQGAAWHRIQRSLPGYADGETVVKSV